MYVVLVPPPPAAWAGRGVGCVQCLVVVVVLSGDGKCVVCDSYVKPHTLVRICDECNYGSYEGRCVICGGVGISDAHYCKECTVQEKDVCCALPCIALCPVYPRLCCLATLPCWVCVYACLPAVYAWTLLRFHCGVRSCALLVDVRNALVPAA